MSKEKQEKDNKSKATQLKDGRTMEIQDLPGFPDYVPYTERIEDLRIKMQTSPLYKYFGVSGLTDKRIRRQGTGLGLKLHIISGNEYWNWLCRPDVDPLCY